jgi:hypothetical protein
MRREEPRHEARYVQQRELSTMRHGTKAVIATLDIATGMVSCTIGVTRRQGFP